MTMIEAANGRGDRTSRQGRLGEEAYRGPCLDHVGQVRLRARGYQYHRDRRPIVAFLKRLSKIEAALFAEIHIDKRDVGP